MTAQGDIRDRLVLIGNSDNCRKKFKCTGRTQIAVAVFWGLRKDRKLAFHLTIDWKEGSKAPTFEIIRGGGIVRTTVERSAEGRTDK